MGGSSTKQCFRIFNNGFNWHHTMLAHSLYLLIIHWDGTMMSINYHTDTKKLVYN